MRSIVVSQQKMKLPKTCITLFTTVLYVHFNNYFINTFKKTITILAKSH